MSSYSGHEEAPKTGQTIPQYGFKQKATCHVLCDCLSNTKISVQHFMKKNRRILKKHRNIPKRALKVFWFNDCHSTRRTSAQNMI